MTGRIAIVALLALLGGPSLAAPSGRDVPVARAAFTDHIAALARLRFAAQNCSDASVPNVDNAIRVVGAYAVGYSLMPDDRVVAVVEAESAKERARIGTRCVPLAPKFAHVGRTHRRLMRALRRLPQPR